jgi:RNA polymerase sigma-70 factor (ECF subfamily)
MTTATTLEAAELADLVREHQAGVWRYLRFLGCDAPQADDLTQETFLAVVRKPLEVRSRRETAAYLRTVARRQLLMHLRQQKREPVVADLQAADVVWAAAAGDNGLEDYLDALRECLQSAVDDRARTALELQYHHSASRSQIAERLDLAAEGVKTLLRRARASLRACVERKLNQQNVLSDPITNGREPSR